MKKNLNIIQIKGTRGLLLAAGFVCCLAAGFVYFPGWVCMQVWNQAIEEFNLVVSTTEVMETKIVKC